MVSGAQSARRAVRPEELAAKLAVPSEMVATEINELVVLGYAEVIGGEMTPRVYLTGTGIITASSTYS
jgi:hypothetical protein